MNKIMTFPGKLGIQQRVVPSYRIEFFDLLAESCGGGMSVFAGEVPQQETIPTSGELKVAKYSYARNNHFRDINSAYYFLWQGGFIHWLEDWNPDVLIIEANARYLSTFQAIRWMRSRGRPVIGWGLGAPEIEARRSIGNRVRKLLRDKMLGQLDALIAYSHKGAAEYQEATSLEMPVYAATNAVARRPVGQIPVRKSEFDDRPIVIYVGRLQVRKRLDSLLLACSKLPDEIQPILWIVGNGPEREKLEDLSKSIYARTEFMGRRVGTELSELFNRADIFVLPGTGGLAVQEAMSHALPVIVAEGDGTQVDLVHPENGWLIPPDDEQALLETLHSALSDADRLRQMGINSYKIVQQQVNIDEMVNTFVDVLNKTSKLGSI